jgi:chemotaxis protein histidine kinase CheA/ActR/RegA family two-component response regulator
VSSARDQLLQRFRISAIERLRPIGVSLSSSELGHIAPQIMEAVQRELHTIKGESRMLGLRAVSSFIHRLEELLQPVPAGSEAPAGVTAIVRHGIEQLVSVLAETPLNDAALAALLEPLQDELTIGSASSAASQRERPAGTSLSPPPLSATSSGSLPPALSKSSAHGEQRWVYVDMQRIDDLCDGTAELETTFRALFAQAQSILGQRNPSSSALRALREDFERSRAQFDDVTSRVWTLRLVPVEPILVQLAQHAYELARGQGKAVIVHVDSASAQLERGILDSLWEPLLHLVRNAIDHGVELPAERGTKTPEASLELVAESHGASVTLAVRDDGRGIDPVAVRAAAIERGLLTPAAAEALSEAGLQSLLFQHGFSTRRRVTDLSGRGVGLDVVRKAVESVGGTVTLTSTVGAGTTFRLTLPTRLSRERALVFAQQGTLFAIPARQVLDVLNLREHTVRTVAGGMALWSPVGVLPLYSMTRALGGDGGEQVGEEQLALIVSTGNQYWAFSLPGVVGEFELIRKPCDPLLAACLRVVASATLDDGRLVLYLNPAEILARAQRKGGVLPRARQRRAARVLIIDDSAIIRHLLSLVLAAGGYVVGTAENGRHGLRYCEEQLPDVILCDLDMPEMDGMELLSHVRARWPDLPVIIFTNHANPELKQKAYSLGASEYVVKADFDQETLLHAVERVLGSRRHAGL